MGRHALDRAFRRASRRTLVDVKDEVDRWLNAPLHAINPDGTLWYNQWIAGLLFREAEAMLAQAGG